MVGVCDSHFGLESAVSSHLDQVRYQADLSVGGTPRARSGPWKVGVRDSHFVPENGVSSHLEKFATKQP